jgi:hypothetical protein
MMTHGLNFICARRKYWTWRAKKTKPSGIPRDSRKCWVVVLFCFRTNIWGVVRISCESLLILGIKKVAQGAVTS